MPRILVTDAQEYAVLGCLRSLHDQGHKVTGVGSTRGAPGLWSRLVDRRFVAPDPRHSVEAFVSRLGKILSSEPYDLVMAGTDASLFVVSAHRDQLAPLAELGLPSHEVVKGVLNRARLGRAAARAGLDFPESRLCDAESDAIQAARDIGCPVLVKPLHTVVAVDGAVKRWGSVVARDLEAVGSVARALGKCLVQRMIPGPVLAVAGVATDDGLLGLVVSRAIRSWPPKTGASFTFCETIVPPSRLAERVQIFVDDVQWTGMFELEVIAGQDGDLSAIDFNPRPYGSLSLAVAAGVPLPALWSSWLLGQAPQIREPRIGARFRWEDGDLRHMIRDVSNGDFRSGLTILRPRRDVTHAYFQLRDPVPAAARVVEILRLERSKARK